MISLEEATGQPPRLRPRQPQLRRHLRPEIFAKLPDKTLQKYADALQISIGELKRTEDAD